MFSIASLQNSVLTRRLVLGLLLFLFSLFLFAPSADAQTCTNPSDAALVGVVSFLECSEVKSSAAVTSVNIPYPEASSQIAAGELLITMLSVDAAEGFATPSGWIKLVDENSGGTNLAVFKRVADGTEGGSENFNWFSTEPVIASMMRFSGTTGKTEVTFVESGAGGFPGTDSTPAVPAITPAYSNYMALRLGAFDDDDADIDRNPIIAGHTNINQDESGNAGNMVSMASAFVNVPAGGTTAQADFTQLAAEGYVTATVAIEFGAASPATAEAPGLTCPRGSDGIKYAGQLVIFEQCTQSGTTGGTSITIATPGQTAVGDLMVAMIVSDGDRTIAEPVGWTALNEGVSGAAVTVGFYSKFITAGELASYVWDVGAGEDKFGFIMRFSGASGQFVSSFVNGSNVQSPVQNSVTTNLANSLILRLLGSDDDDIDLNPVELIPDYTNITADRSRAAGASSSGQGAYINQASVGATGTTRFYHIRNEQSRSSTIAVEPYEFRFSMPDTTASVCGVQQVTLRVTDRLNNPITNFTGSVDLSITTTVLADAVGAQWLDVDSSLNGTLGASTNGAATYTFDTDDNGVAVFDFHSPNATSVNFNLVHDDNGPTFTENSSFDPTLVVDDNCRFNISHDGVAGTCSIDAITITLVDSEDNTATIYDNETATITQDVGVGGNFSINTGSGTLAPNPDNDNNGAVSYTFVAADNGQVVLNYSNTTAQTINFDVEDTTNGFQTNLDPSLVISACEIRISVAAGPIDVCSIIQVTFSVTDSTGSAITGFDGSIELKAQSDQGNWSALAAVPGTLNNNDGGPDNGRASYNFSGTEVGGAVTLNFRHPSINAALSFDASDDLDAVSSLNVSAAPGQDPSINVQGCTVVVSTPDTSLSDVSQANVCAAGERVIYTVTNSQATTATSFKGLIVLQADGVISDVGDYAKAAGAPTGVLGGYGALDNGAGNDGIATYTFAPDDATPASGDLGVLEVVYTTNTADAVTFGASTTGITAAGADRTLTFNDCVARISFPSDTAPFETDVCTIKQVQILIAGFNGETVTDYAGNIALSTSTTLGTWADTEAGNLGVLSGGTAGNGGASYNFVAGDNGDVVLDFLHAGDNAAAVNINVVGSGGVSDPGSPGSTFDPNLFVDVCTFQISYDGGGASSHADFTKTACTVQEVTIEVFRSAGEGGGLATDYNGTVQLSTSLNHGNWSDASVAVTDMTGDDDGQATAVFVSTGSITIDFVNLNTEFMSVNVNDLVNGLAGAIVEDGAADPNLNITSCTPVLTQSCAANGNNFADITIDARNTNTSLQGRMVLMALTWEGNDTLSTTQFDSLSAGDNGNAAMTEIITELLDAGFFDSNTYLYGILDADLPSTGGSFRGAYTTTGTPSVGMCLLYVTDVEQSFPTQAVPGTSNPTDPVNSSSATNTKVATTAITTTQNNALVVSVIGAGSGSDSDTAVFFDQVSPAPPMTQLFARNDDPAGADFTASTGVSANAGLFTVDETYSTATGAIPNRWTHLVASFNPIITGPPVPVGYVPVTLFDTYSGDISYVAIGATLRAGNNGSGNSCTFVASRSAQLNLPEIDETDTGTYPGIVDFGTAAFDDPDSEILDAYLYWMASGDQEIAAPGNGYNTVDFVTPSGTTTLTADDLFVIDNVGSASNSDYYAAYKRVTDLMPAMGSINGTYNVLNIDVDNGAPWNGFEGCGGGWSLVVVYKNPYEEFRVVNLFHGFQPFQNSAFTLVPRNFRMAKDVPGTETPNGLVTHVTLEGDETLSTGDESLKIQDQPGGTDANLFFVLDTPFNPPGTEFNGTVTRPIFELVDTDATAGVNYKYVWDSTASNGTNRSGGYEIDFPGVVFPPTSAALAENGGSWGMDIDTHYISGDQEAAEGSDDNVLFDFADQQTEEITTRYSSGQDLVLLVHEAISVENAPIADIEVTITEGVSSTFKVGSTGNTYNIVVKNNGNGATSYGTANGTIVLAGSVPTGMTLTSLVGTGWSCTITTTAYTCTNDVTALGATPLNTLVATVSVTAPDVGSPPIAFPSLNNNATVFARVAHYTDTLLVGCTAATGFIPDPDNCNSSPEFDNVNDLQGGVVDINDLDLKTGNNNNVDSVTTVVKGIETELAITKSIVSLLENDGVVAGGGEALYTLAVTNNGPDAFVYSAGNREIKIVDDEPSGIDFASGTGTSWTCPITAGSPDQMNCAFTGSLAVGATTTVTVLGYVTGTPGALVSNTATVSTGLYNFDQTGTNNTSTNNTNITAPVASATERFLLSVSSGGTSSIGDGSGSLDFTDNDLIIYNPVLDEAVMYLDNSALSYGLDDPNAVHLLPNGHVILSADGASTIGGNAQAFEPNDLVSWDPITGQGTLFFDQSTATGAGILAGENIDAVYVLDGGTSGDFIFSTTNDVAGGIGWSDSDLVFYDASTGTFSIYLNGEDANVFDSSTADVDALYLGTNTTDPFGTPLNEFYLSSDNQNTTIGDDSSIFGQDDVVQFNPDAIPGPGSSTSETIFRGNVPIGVFSTPSGTNVDTARRLNALHVLQDGYIGHFSIIQSQAGNACTAGEIRIVKHLNIAGHATDTNYTGSIEITGDTVGGADAGTWTIVSGNGTLNNNAGGSTTNGQAVYTYVGSDNGDVTLGLNVTEDPPVSRSIDVNVTNRLVQELGIEDDDFDFNLVVQAVNYKDNVDSAAYNNSDGVASWAGPWVEVDDTGSGASSGKANALGGKLNLTSTPSSGTVPSLSREADLEPFDVTETVFLNFDYTYANANAVDEIELYVTVDGTLLGGGAFATYTGLSGTNASATAVSLNLSTLAPTDGMGDKFTGITKIEFRVGSGYTTSGVFSIDNVEIATGTTDCNFGAIDHFDIIVGSETGLACVVSTVRIEAHNSVHDLIAPGAGATIDLSTSTGSGTWPSKITGTGTLSDATAGDGQASYTFTSPTETFIELNFNYTNPDTGLNNSPVGDNPLVNFNLDGLVSGIAISECEDGDAACSNDHDPSITFDEVGLIFTTGDNLVTTTPTAIPFQISGKPSTTAPFSALPTIQLVRSVLGTGNEASACSSLVPDGSLVTIKMAAVCENPGTCSAGVTLMPFVNDVTPTPATIQIPVFNDGAQLDPAGAGTNIQLLFENTGTTVDGSQNIAATLDFTYPDAGKISFHGQYEIPFNNDVAGGTTVGGVSTAGGLAKGSSNQFIVRPYGFDIDFSGDRRADSNQANDVSRAADANGPAFARAGDNFSTTVAAVAWDGSDALGADGKPAFGTDLSDNPITANFGNETSLANDPTVLVSVVTDLVAPDNDDNPGVPSGVVGSISSGSVFDGFNNGTSTHDMAINEVGIFDLDAVLVQNSGNLSAVNYFEEVASQGVIGGTENVGRFYPAYFELVSSSFDNRANQSCSPSSSFTYMGEDFGINFVLQAKNALNADTKNYFGNFAKLTTRDELDIKAIVQTIATDSNVTSRLSHSTFTTISPTFMGDWTSDIGSVAANASGSLSIIGNMRFNRKTTAVAGSEDGPFVNVDIAFAPLDLNGDVGVPGNDVQIGSGYNVLTDETTSIFDVDIDNDGTNVLKLFSGATTQFRYGRLRLEDSFGSETEPLGIGIVAEYWDGSQFILNAQDSCTSVNFDVSTPSLTVVADSAVPADYITVPADELEESDVPIESGTVVDFTVTLSGGTTNANDINGTDVLTDPDRPLIAGPTVDQNVGTVIVELDLDNTTSPNVPSKTLDFLKYDWRTEVGPNSTDLYDEIPEGANYTDNPRAILEFGSYRGHDRIINWQEIYIGPN